MAQWLGWDSPSLIYNQGRGEDAFDFSSRSYSFNDITDLPVRRGPGWLITLLPWTVLDASHGVTVNRTPTTSALERVGSVPGSITYWTSPWSASHGATSAM